MLVAIVLLIVPTELNIPVPAWWTRLMALFLVSGAAAEIFAVWSFVRAGR
jgi:hypothetical protein